MIRVVNLKQVIGDFKSYDKKTQKRFRATLNKYAKIVKTNQYQVLRRRVKVWSGHLGGSIGIRHRKWWHKEVGPEINYKLRRPYARFIESGGQPYGNPHARRFGGYWYIKYSMTKVRGPLREQIKRDMKT